ncbi:CPBP family intramembrane metalloprotease [Lactobacillus sp. LC28-10]|uniref:CPBP family intramembrane metalloprotease n=1 Tax=Secundilactobacillus angelensis TaxID=2722706 RepID=A0ABX1KXA5_9LACO|nr:type II CAAX endopeptidase family protein [Secundilactobacillus angelensis]MCH5461433.1 CPBP family intramembrane metalloprotease [Secundilactobacillus angelensis]NLR17754.1 CPBP family intramembrane metalloprotease [Secundilactobacillus angelensis]
MLHQRAGRQLLSQYGYFLVLWFVIQVFVNVPIINLSRGWTQELLTDGVKILIWLGIGLFMIHRTKKNQFEVERPFQVNLKFKPLYITLAAIVIYMLVSAFIQRHSIGIVATFNPTMLLQDFLVVGICEETVFRGYLLNRLRKIVDSEQSALIIQAILFALVHLPKYLTTYPVPSVLTILGQLVTVAILGYLFGWLFLRSRSLWPGIIVHSVWDLLIVLLIGG